MSTYGRNFEFRAPPRSSERGGRYSIGGSDALVIGAPVMINQSTDSLGRLEVELAAADDSKPLPGAGGVLVYEYGPSAYSGDDASLVTYSDKGTVEVGQAVQVVSGTTVKVVLRNTPEYDFLNTRTYSALNMVASAALGATPVEPGDMLTPGAGNSTDGYWKKTATAGDAWLIVTKVDTNRGEIEALLNF